ncbi:MAG: hypothetical protein KAI02_03865 [Gammaproteobacteria bacterium]|nr:hypothetical protein [Gammaproteobacteria bacterium]
MIYHKRALIILVLFSFFMTGCASHRYQEPKDVDLIPVSQKAAQDLLAQSKDLLAPGSLVVVSSFINVNDLNKTSAFGRITSSQISSAIFKAGYRIRSMELSTEDFIQTNSGFHKLSLEAKMALKEQGAAALVVGVFAPGRKIAYVNVRMVDLNVQEVMASTDFSVPMGADAKVLLKSRKTGANESE